MEKDSTIRLERVSVVDQRGQQIIDDLTFSAGPGEILALLGPSGCGKTTTLKLIAGLIKPGVGSVLVGGASPELACRQGRVGIAFQQPTLLPWRSARSNIELPFEILNQTFAGADVDQLAALVRLESCDLAKRPLKLSGGMAQRVSLARALATRPDFLLLDEPFSSLDSVLRKNLNIELGAVLHTRQPTTIVVTHNVEDAIFLADRILVMTGGQGHAGRLCYTLDVPFPRPRGKDLFWDPEFLSIREHCEGRLTSAHANSTN